MLSNNNDSVGFSSFSEMPFLSYKIIEVLLESNTEQAESLWKLLKYPTVDCLEKENLTFEEKRKMIWFGDPEEQNYNVFVKPLLGSSMFTAEAQTQLRIFRNNTQPIDNYNSIVHFETDFITNEKSSLVRKDRMICERTDLMESYYLDIMNGRDITIGSGYLTFNKEYSRSCNSQLNISNSKSFYGRTLMMALNYSNVEYGGVCY